MRCKKIIFLTGILIFVILFINLVSSQVFVGNLSEGIDSTYNALSPLSGWINISLQSEPASSLVSAFNSNMSLKDFLDSNNVFYSCSPADCNLSYSVSNPEASKSFSLNSMQTKIIGLKFTGQITGVSSIGLNINTDGGMSCTNPISVDVLDDGVMDYRSENFSNDFSCYSPDYFGCYESKDNSGTALITTAKYCEKIDLRAPSRAFQVGAVIIKNSNDSNKTSFNMEVDTGSATKSCVVNATSTGEISCVVDLDHSLESDVSADVCLSAVNSADNGKYQINYDTVNPCGFSGNQPYDFPIFAKAGKFNPAGNINFGQNSITKSGINLANEIYNYIDEKYNGNCTLGCIVPIAIISGLNQNVTLSNLNLMYSAGISKSENNFYEAESTDAIISMDYQKLDISKANLSVGGYGSKVMELYVGEKKISEKNIQVNPFSQMTLSPTTFPVLVPIMFSVSGVFSANSVYNWNFGDGSSPVITNVSNAAHTYQSPGDYQIIVSVSNANGKTSQSFSVNAGGSAQDYINSTIGLYKSDLININNQMDSIGGWAGTEIKNILSLDDINSTVALDEVMFSNASTEEDYSSIVNDLSKIKIPYQTNITEVVQPSEFILSDSQFDSDLLGKAGAGEANISEDYFSPVNRWVIDNLFLSVESKTYSFVYHDGTKSDISDVKITVKPKSSDVGTVYMVINGDSNEIILNGDNSTDLGGNAVGLSFDASTEKTVEFLHPSSINPIDVPVIISPNFSRLEFSVSTTSSCNNNGKCESELGETTKNCKNDCRSWNLTATMLAILFFIAFVIYIIMQEWYKRHYESSLFPNKNQLFNLVNFMNNSENQGMKKPEIFTGLENFSWTNEQLNYAWRKLHGMRTGMWEIPIFKWIENNQVKSEIQKRQGMSNRI